MTSDLIILPIHRAVLCEACQSLTNSAGHRCEVCGSIAIVSLSRLISREFDTDPLGQFSIAEICAGIHLRKAN